MKRVYRLTATALAATVLALFSALPSFALYPPAASGPLRVSTTVPVSGQEFIVKVDPDTFDAGSQVRVRYAAIDAGAVGDVHRFALVSAVSDGSAQSGMTLDKAGPYEVSMKGTSQGFDVTRSGQVTVKLPKATPPSGGPALIPKPVQTPDETAPALPSDDVPVQSAVPAKPAPPSAAASPPSSPGVGPTAEFHLTIDAQTGAQVAGSQITLSGEGMLPGSTVHVFVHSEPIHIGDLTVDSATNFKGTLALPAGLETGAHRVIADGTGVNGQPVSDYLSFWVDSSGNLGGVGDEEVARLQEAADANAPEAEAAASGSSWIWILVICVIVLAVGAGVWWILLRYRKRSADEYPLV